MTFPRLHSSAFPNSSYAAELHRGVENRVFSSEAEAEYLRSQLLGNRTLIRVACLLAVLLSMLRGAELLLGASWAQAFPLSVALILITSVVLSAVAWTRAFERFYLPLAKVLVPFRNTIAAVFIA